jgi:hypothetical protein
MVELVNPLELRSILKNSFRQTNPRDPSPLMEAQGDVAQLGVNSFIMLLLL